MAEDPYRVLGVSRTATDAEVRRRYRKLVNEWHPDRNKSPGAEERFKEIAAANAIIGDPDKRRRFDRGEIDASGEPRRWTAGAGAGAGGGPAGGGSWRQGGSIFDTEDPFSDIFAAFRAEGATRRPRRGPDARYTLEIEFLEAVNGAKRRVTIPGGGVLDITVPAGVAEGQVLRLKGKGPPAPGGGEPGDALVEIRIKPSPTFRRQGNDIQSDLPLTLDEAVLGARVEVATVTGRVSLTVPKGTSSGRVFRLKGKGVPGSGGAPDGDHLVTIRVVMPPEIDDDLAGFMERWRTRHRYDPGRR